MNIIERTDEQYVQDLRELYEEHIQPQILAGKSLTKALEAIGKHTSTRHRWYREIRQFAIEDGYKPRSRGRVKS